MSWFVQLTVQNSKTITQAAHFTHSRTRNVKIFVWEMPVCISNYTHFFTDLNIEVIFSSLERATVWTCPHGTREPVTWKQILTCWNLLAEAEIGMCRASGLPGSLTVFFPCTALISLTFIFLSNCNTCSGFGVTHRGNVSEMALVVCARRAGLLFIVQYKVQNRSNLWRGWYLPRISVMFWSSSDGEKSLCGFCVHFLNEHWILLASSGFVIRS